MKNWTVLTKIKFLSADENSMNMRKLILLNLIFCSVNLYADNQRIDDEYYQEILKRHQSSGQINDQDVQEQKFKLSKDKEWQQDFRQQVRGVASSMSPVKETIKLSNPAIEISVK